MISSSKFINQFFVSSDISVFDPVAVEHDHVAVVVEPVWLGDEPLQRRPVLRRQPEHPAQVARPQLPAYPLHQTVGRPSPL